MQEKKSKKERRSKKDKKDKKIRKRLSMSTEGKKMPTAERKYLYEIECDVAGGKSMESLLELI